jgi:collagen type VII alpha
MKSVVRTASGMAMACVFAVTVAAQSGSTADPQDAGQGTSTTTQQPSTTGTSGEYGAEQRDQDRDRSQTEARSQTGQITLTGCLQGSQGNWMLTQAAMAGGAMSGAGHTAGTEHGQTGAQADATAGQTGATAGVGQSETAGTAGTAGMHAQTKSYRLQAESAHNDDLRNKVGKRVEIRGSFVGASSSYGQAGQAGQAGQSGQYGAAGQSDASSTTGAQAGQTTGTTTGTTAGAGQTGASASAGVAPQQVKVESVREIAGDCPADSSNR